MQLQRYLQNFYAYVKFESTSNIIFHLDESWDAI